MSKHILFVILFMLSIAIGPVRAGETFKLAFVLSGPVSDYGYNYSHNEARQYIQSHLKNVEASLVENVPESADAERVMEKLVVEGNKLIFATSFGYLEAAERVAKRHPNTVIMTPWRTSNVPNVGGYAVLLYEPLYVVGMVAGRMTKTNNIGIVCAHPIPVTLQNINAIALGARSVNPKVKVHVAWTNSWSDAPTETEATKALIEANVDVVGSELSNPLSVAKAGEKAHVMTISNQTDLNKIVPNGWLTGSRWNWGETLLSIVKAVQNGTWKKDFRVYDMKDGTAELSSFGKIVPKTVQEEALTLAQKAKKGKEIVFVGPLSDRERRQRLRVGEVANEKFISSMDWFVDGVVGPLPKH